MKRAHVIALPLAAQKETETMATTTKTLSAVERARVTHKHGRAARAGEPAIGQLTIRLTLEERANLDAHAEMAGGKTATFARERLAELGLLDPPKRKAASR